MIGHMGGIGVGLMLWLVGGEGGGLGYVPCFRVLMYVLFVWVVRYLWCGGCVGEYQNGGE